MKSSKLLSLLTALATAVLVTDSEALAEAVAQEIERQLKTLPREEIARASIDNNGKIIVTGDLAAAIDVANALAPEHLELCVEQPFDYLDRITNAGSIFLGKNCPEALGDYLAGPNHTLPTSGTARFSVTGDHGAAEVKAIGVGGNFFHFHPLRLRSGSYIAEDDFMLDRVVLDETLAWQLFGGFDHNFVLNAGGTAAGADLSAYPDASSVSSWAAEAMGWAVSNGILSGNEAGQLNPGGAATRAEVAVTMTQMARVMGR